jgi:thymidylate synthase ThyX
MLTIEWQALTPEHGYEVPEDMTGAGLADEFHEAMERSEALYDAVADPFPTEAPYAVALAYRVRFSMQFNAREAIHMLELRTSPQGHPAYRRVCQEMHRLIEQQAGHRALAGAMRHVDHATYGLERLESERAAQARRATR